MGRFRKGAQGAAIISAGLVLGSVAAILPGPASQARSEAPATRTLQDACSPDFMQSVVTGLSGGVAVKPIRNGPNFPGGVKYMTATDKTPAFCQVTGSFVTNPETGKTANFLATFPANWNGKYLQMGCSGHCGQFAVSDPAQVTVVVTNQGHPMQSILKGYASFATDEGHEGFAGGTWAVKGPGQVDQDAIDDLFYRAQKVLTTTGKAMTGAFYGGLNGSRQTIARSYFNGCSGGGRDAFVAASYFPEEFDGIIGGSAYNGMGGAFQLAGLSLASIRSEGAYLPPELIQKIDPIVKAQCDGFDGVKDGLIQNPAACNFNPERDLPKCTGSNAGQCFSPEQIETVSVMLTAVTDEKGNVVQPGMSVSDIVPRPFITPKRPADLAARDPFPNSDDGNVMGNGYWPLADAVLKVFVHQNDPNFYTRSVVNFRSGGPGAITDYRAVVPASEVALAKARTGKGIGHFPKNLDRLIKQDRKFLIWHNLSDEVLTPYMSINYYKQLAQRNGGYDKLQRNVRLFTLPGTSHCSGGGIGVGPNTFDALTSLENWVEKGQAPDALMASYLPANSYGLRDFSKTGGRTMPLCKFPEMARYKGAGDVNDGANWECPSGDKRMLRVGESGRRAGVIR